MKLICTACPVGCELDVTEEAGEIKVVGNTCKRGITYGQTEYTDPRRTVTSVMRIIGGDRPVVSVKTAAPVPKASVRKVLDIIAYTSLNAPVRAGETVVQNIEGTDIVATSGTNKIFTKRKKRT